MLRTKYCPRKEIQRLEIEFWNLAMEGCDVTGYTARFHELSRVVPYLVNLESKRIERYIWGLSHQIRSMVITSNPPTFLSAVSLAHRLTDNAKRDGIFEMECLISIHVL